MKYFRIHGDNIVECERAFKLIVESLSLFSGISIGPPDGSAIVPTYKIRLDDLSQELEFTFFPGFGRWEVDIISYGS